MTFLARFLGWALLLGLPAWAFGDRYRWLLARALEGTLALLGQHVDLDRVDALAPMDLVLFASLTLASDAWSWRLRVKALAVGTAALIGIEVAAWTLYLGTLMAAARSGPSTAAAESLWHSVLGAAAWLAAVAAWTLGPGAAMLDRASRRERPARVHHSRSAKRPG